MAPLPKTVVLIFLQLWHSLLTFVQATSEWARGSHCWARVCTWGTETKRARGLGAQRRTADSQRRFCRVGEQFGGQRVAAQVVTNTDEQFGGTAGAGQPKGWRPSGNDSAAGTGACAAERSPAEDGEGAWRASGAPGTEVFVFWGGEKYVWQKMPQCWKSSEWSCNYLIFLKLLLFLFYFRQDPGGGVKEGGGAEGRAHLPERVDQRRQEEPDWAHTASHWSEWRADKGEGDLFFPSRRHNQVALTFNSNVKDCLSKTSTEQNWSFLWVLNAEGTKQVNLFYRVGLTNSHYLEIDCFKRLKSKRKPKLSRRCMCLRQSLSD